MTRYLMSLQSIAISSASSTTSSPNLEKYKMNLESYSMTASEFLRVPSRPYLARVYRKFNNLVLDILKLSVILI